MQPKEFYSFCKNTCWYKDVCSNYDNAVECNSFCVRYMEMWHLINYSGLPKNYNVLQSYIRIK